MKKYNTLLRFATTTLFIALFVFAKAQQTDTAFSREWKLIDSLIAKNNLTKTALAHVNTIYTRASQKKVKAHILKAIIYRYTLNGMVTDNDPVQSIAAIETEINTNGDEVQKAILHTLLAKKYLEYYDNYRWDIHKRSNTNTTDKDITTWGATNFIKVIQSHFHQSLANEKLLQQTRLDVYDAIIIKGNARQLRPTLFDLLAHEALEYFKYGEERNVKPAAVFTLSDTSLLHTAESFVKRIVPTKDSSSLQWQAVHLFKKLLAFHLPDANKAALITLERLEWIHSKATFGNKEQLYQHALSKLIDQYPSAPATMGAWYALANAEINKAEGYTPFGDTTHQYSYNRAEEYVRRGMGLVSDTTTEMYANLSNLLLNINKKELRTDIEKVNVPGKPFRALVTYRNTTKLYARIVRVSDDALASHKRWEQTFWGKLLVKPAFQSFTCELPQTNDHQRHATEIKMDALPVGEYVLLISSGNTFSEKTDKLFAHYFHVSNISYVQAGTDYFVLNRETGQPMSNVQVTILREHYSSTKKASVTDAPQLITTDDKGHFSFAPAPQERQRIRFHFSTSTDRLSETEPNNVYYAYGQDNDIEISTLAYEQQNKRVFFFTDRAIYRPGQPVFFKGIAVTKDRTTQLSKPAIDKDSAWVYLNDVNHKKIDSLRYAPNSFGSFNGVFRLPQNTLTGSFSIEATDLHGRMAHYFSVEEYKRPTFNISFEKVKGVYRLNDSIIITGTAKAYAGNAINAAAVKYHVQRNSVYQPYPWARISHRGTASREIANGNLHTDAAGRFTIRCKALADDITDRSGNPLFSFSIQVDITDISGETRTARNSITAGFAALQLTLNTTTISKQDSSKNITVKTTNMNNEKEPAIVQLHVYPLQPPARLIRKRYWARPDQFAMTKNEFLQHFPSDEYDNETNYVNWPSGTAIVERKIDTKDSTACLIPAGTLPAGHYKIEAITKDKYGEEIKQQFFTQIFDSKSGLLPAPNYSFAYTAHNIVEPGETATFLSGTSASRIYLIRKTEWPAQKQKKYDHEVQNKGIHTTLYTAQESDRGNSFISEMYVLDNRVYINRFTIVVPWSNKQLKITYDTYRSTTEPGSPEKWTVSIQGNKSDSSTAELLTAMYDASLDQFKHHNWNLPTLWPTNYQRNDFNGNQTFALSHINADKHPIEYYRFVSYTVYDRIASSAEELWPHGWDDADGRKKYSVAGAVKGIVAQESYDYDKVYSSPMIANGYSNSGMQRKDTDGISVRVGGITTLSRDNQQPLYMIDGVPGKAIPAATDILSMEILKSDEAIALYGSAAANGAIIIVTKKGSAPTQIRKNFNETAFFFPQLYADSSGKFSFSFTMPEALTQWKWMTLAHTKDLAFGSNSTTVITQKKLMVQPNAPRFMREGDNMELSTKIVNLSDKEIKGQATLELIDPVTNTPVDGWFHNVFPLQYFTAEAGQSVAVKFPVQIPFSYNKPLTWRIIARSDNISDGEENTLPVLTNRMLVTETLPLYLAKDTTQSFVFNKLTHNPSESLTHESITVEYTSNPVWNAVQALPYLTEYPYECAEQVFNRFYANTLASHIVTKHPRIKQVFEQWRKDTSVLRSTLQKNEELKQILLQETPWVLEAVSETQQKQNLALLFDPTRLSAQSDLVIKKIEDMQLPDGSFSWFQGGYADRYITNYILTGIGKLKRIGALSANIPAQLRTVLVKALQYMDKTIADEYKKILTSKASLAQRQTSGSHIDYLFMRSFFRDIAIQSKEAHDYYYRQAKLFWTKQNSYHQAQLGIVCIRNNDISFTAQTLWPSLLENAMADSTKGLYWKNAYTGFWYQSPVEHQSMMMALAAELRIERKEAVAAATLDAMKTWLLLNKQTNNWKTTVATADACYALLLNGNDWLNNEKTVTIKLGNTVTVSNIGNAEAGTGYFKKRIDGKQVNSEMGNISVSTNSKLQTSNSKLQTSPSWGNIYWQYFEDLDKITASATPLSLAKKLFVEKNTDKGKILLAVNENDELKVGDKIVVRMVLKSDRDMDYLHLKDMRAATMEPTNVLSGYKWQDGLGYYESTRDASTNFFIDHLRKGTYVFEYPLFVTHAGAYSVGIASIQCMYAPEFTSHSEGMKIRVAN